MKKELQEARLLAEVYSKMIEMAEHEFKIKVIKSPVPINPRDENLLSKGEFRQVLSITWYYSSSILSAFLVSRTIIF